MPRRTGPQGDEITIATSTGGPLSAPHDVATAPSFGAMRDAVVGPHGTIWVVSEVAGGKKAVQVRPGLSNAPVTLTTPYLIGDAQIRFASATPVLVVDKDGAISSPVSVASQHGGTWSSSALWPGPGRPTPTSAWPALHPASAWSRP